MRVIKSSLLAFALAVADVHDVRAFAPHPSTVSRAGFSATQTTVLHSKPDGVEESASLSEQHVVSSRRDILRVSAASAIGLTALSSPLFPASAAAKVTGASDGNLPDFPSEAVRSYLQYRTPLQISADYYIWELQDKMTDVDEWGEIGQLFRVNNNRGQGQPSRIERDFVNPMRILGLSMDPDVADSLRDSQFQFEKAMAKISKATAGVRRDLSVEIEPTAIPKAQEGWDEGRMALNSFFLTLNEATGLNELQTIPPAGPNQTKEYGRNPRKFFELMKKTKLCQNRGGPTLSQAWGQLMVSGYMQDSCGIPDMEAYFFQ
uniref:Uncharacterized protein n=1 Tax=Helicotheca tamesis TaxID=374047 RepID=A0A7S2HFZ0_9STRA|mmetsp:Transcript_17634/g.24298  ORF Transcript_17634/g.24298 Transcript_17634/m.24298 type:complete len:319 (+) Transcript_17634:25-981(+)|eukprot:CAMPEP_0185724870 /NCGR_PEP_ID=MMETSP1171-20130828/1230_1 /TAXON_ID=374046 /ORGANISM="Helicotheca tamensis, Strain CCMP826" /LENGTH=318 /DNA_ID=CAMNT_0028392819 /DNA_START=28 /DNA_END=984 /DNA_ORIENTATION=-